MSVDKVIHVAIREARVELTCEVAVRKQFVYGELFCLGEMVLDAATSVAWGPVSLSRSIVMSVPSP